MLEAIVLIPGSPEVNASFCQKFTTDKTRSTNRAVLLTCHPSRPAVVWRALWPTLFQSPKRIAQQALTLLLEHYGIDLCCQQSSAMEETWSDMKLDVFKGKTRRRKIPLTSTEIRRKLIVWIEPPSTTHFHTYFARALVTLENQMILYQTRAAWISTLGGGYFFCRHLTTALRLAQQQLKVALLMGDYNMAYKCIINQAYSYIYAGRFSTAMKTIDSINVLNRKVDVHPLELVIINMQKSAKLFCRRFHKASKKLEAVNQNSNRAPPLTSDDYQRIRIVQDQSRTKDTSNRQH